MGSGPSVGVRRPTLMMIGEKGHRMKFKVTIKEISKCVVDVEAESLEEAREKAEQEYWENPNDYVLEPEDTFFE